MNPIQLMQLIRQSSNPQSLVMNLMQQKMGTNPMFSNLLSLAQQGKQGEIEQIARNICKEKGIDFDKEFNSFRKQTGL